MPPIMAVKMPEMGGKLLAMAMPKHKGRAIRKTLNPAIMSFFIPLIISVSFQAKTMRKEQNDQGRYKTTNSYKSEFLAEGMRVYVQKNLV